MFLFCIVLCASKKARDFYKIKWLQIASRTNKDQLVLPSTLTKECNLVPSDFSLALGRPAPNPGKSPLERGYKEWFYISWM